jgi:hypothetical protein
MPDIANEVFVQRFARVFFQVGAHQAHGLFLVAQPKKWSPRRPAPPGFQTG